MEATVDYFRIMGHTVKKKTNKHKTPQPQQLSGRPKFERCLLASSEGTLVLSTITTDIMFVCTLQKLL